MKIKILKRNAKVLGFPGDVVECDAPTGNYLATVGIAEVVEHDRVETKPIEKKVRDYRPKWVKQAEADGYDTSHIKTKSTLTKHKEVVPDEPDEE